MTCKDQYDSFETYSGKRDLKVVPPSNTSGIHPVHYNVLIEPREVVEKTAGGLYFPDETKEKEAFARTEGIIVEMSPMAFSQAEWPKGADKPKVGDRVMYRKYNATEMRGNDGKTYWMMADESIQAIVEATS